MQPAVVRRWLPPRMRRVFSTELRLRRLPMGRVSNGVATYSAFYSSFVRVKLNLRALDAFRHTLQGGSATAAARELGISQPAVSRLLARLEREVGFELFWREKGRLIAT